MKKIPIKQIGDKMAYWQWVQAHEYRYDTMPLWWWNIKDRRERYNDYLNEVDDGYE